MVGKRGDEIEIESFYWDYDEGGNVDHIALHKVTPDDVNGVFSNQPRFFNARVGYDGHVMLGPNQEGRYLYVAMEVTWQAGVWAVITAHWMNKARAERLYLRE